MPQLLKRRRNVSGEVVQRGTLAMTERSRQKKHKFVRVTKEVLSLMENQQRRHQFDSVWGGGRGYLKRCSVCQWSWPTRRQSACPGVPRYAYGAWPPTLHPAGELIRLGREVPPTADGCAYQLLNPHWLWLYYDDREIAPYAYSPPKTIRARLRAFFEGGQARCQVCGYEPAYWYAHTIVDGLCRTCQFQCAWCQQVLDIRHWAQSVLQDENAVLLDTETTGLRDDDVVIELVLLSASDRRTLFNSLIRPNQPIPRAVSLRNSLRDEQMRSAPTFHQVWSELLPILENYRTVISYSAAFHKARLDWTAQKYGYQLPPLKWECLMTRYAAFYGKVRPGDEESPFQWQSLYRACRQQKTSPSLMPKAYEQVKAARRLLRAIAEKEGQHWDASR